MSGASWSSNSIVYVLTGNPHDVLKSISERHKLEPSGDPSLQNAIEMAKSSMRSVRAKTCQYSH